MTSNNLEKLLDKFDQTKKNVKKDNREYSDEKLYFSDQRPKDNSKINTSKIIILQQFRKKIIYSFSNLILKREKFIEKFDWKFGQNKKQFLIENEKVDLENQVNHRNISPEIL